MSGWYILDGHEPVPAEMLDAAKWMETADRQVSFTTMGAASVSTVFLGLDHQHGNGPPLLFETLVFGGPFDGEMRRYSTWDEAKAGHAEMVREVTR